MLLSSSTLFVLVFFCRGQKRVDVRPAGAFVCFRLNDAYVVRQRLGRVLRGFRLLENGGEVACRLRLQLAEQRCRGQSSSLGLRLPHPGVGPAQQGGGELIFPQGRFVGEQLRVPVQQPQDPLLRPGGADVLVPQGPFLRLELGGGIQVFPQFRPLFPCHPAFECPLDL